MKVTVIGSGYVGLVSGACLAEMGNDVMCLDRDDRKIKLLQDGKVPLEIIEVQSGSYLGEDDIVRFEDSYGRTK